MKNKPEFNLDEYYEGTYVFDGDHYAIQDGNVFKYTEFGLEYTDDITADQIRFYGEKLKSELHIFELLIRDIKELDCGRALIHGDDGSDFDFWFMDEHYTEHRSRYKIGEKGRYLIMAEILYAYLPDDFRDGVVLKGVAARKFFEWIEEEEALEQEDPSANLPWKEAASYLEAPDFPDTGQYLFNATVNNPAFCESPNEENGGDCFELAVMNQINKLEPRFVTAFFEAPPYVFPEFEKQEDDEDDMFQDGWALKGVMRFIASIEPEDFAEIAADDEMVLLYGDNPVTFPESKGIFEHDDDDMNYDFLEDDDE